MKKIALNLLVLLVLASFVLSACGGAAATEAPAATDAPAATEAPAATGAPSAGGGEGEVAIVAWPGYIERGANDPAYDWVTAFETETGCKVTVKDAATSDEMVQLINSGGFDLVTASGDASLRLIYGESVQEIDTSKIPSYNTIDERLQNAPWHTVDGKHYGVSYQWGPNVLMYNTDVFPEAPTSWNVVFEEQTLSDGKSNKDRVQAYSGPIYIADAALYLMAHNPELGITDPYELNEAQFAAALELLSAQRQIASKYWGDYLVQVEDFKTEGFVAAPSWPLQVNLLQADGAPIASVIPSEGATGWADTTMMAANAPHPECAYLWLEHSLNPKVQGDVAAWFGSNPSVPSACDGASELFTADGCKINGYDSFDKIYFWKTPIAACGNGQSDCVTYDRWTEEFTKIVGQ
ncbi:MAG: ABC transporter substrate-binding protein [Chloroflexi bacterium]|nr:ABC transporter substrate-binding protein [Chloroflexota bacterium]